MAARKILQIGDPRLKAPNKKVDDFKNPKVKKAIKDLVDSMRANELVGMAAPQIGENWKIYVTEPRKTKFRTQDQTDKLRVFINPIITKSSKEESIIYEGCGSVVNGNLFGPVKRPKEITVEAYDKNGKRFRLTCDGLLARVIQHEHDHLNGIEFTEKIMDYKLLVNAEFYLKRIKNSPNQVQSSIITKKKVETI